MLWRLGRLILPAIVLALLVFGIRQYEPRRALESQSALVSQFESLLPPTGPDEQDAPLPQLARPDCAEDVAHLPPPPSTDDRRPNYLHTCGNRLYDSYGNLVRLTGVNWHGLESGNLAMMGLAERNWESILDQIATLGYNAIRLPFSNEVLRPDYHPTGANLALNPDLVGLSGLEILDRLIAGARARGIRVVLDRHRTTTGSVPQLWYDSAVSESDWIADWQKLALRYRGNDTVVGADLHNEPGQDAHWGWGPAATDWRLAAEHAGNAVLAVNPYLLIMVEGVMRRGDDWYWQGGYLDEAGAKPVRLTVPNRLVYEPHDYGPGVYSQKWFYAPDFPANLEPLWQRHWAYLHDRNIAPIVLGEFGGRSLGNDVEGKWQQTLLQLIRQRGLSFFVWSLNPNSSDTGGIFADDWRTVVTVKQMAYAALLAGSLDFGTTTSLGAPRGRLRIDYRPASAAHRTRQLDFSLDVVNDGKEPVPLRGLEVRYWLTTGAIKPEDQQLEMNATSEFPWTVDARLEHVNVKGADSAISLRFTADAPPLQPGKRVGPIRIRLTRVNRSQYVQSNDYSFSPVAQKAWLRVTISHGKDLIWGIQPPG